MNKTWIVPVLGGLLLAGALSAPLTTQAQAQNKKAPAKVAEDPRLAKKIVPILTMGSSVNIGVAQVTGEKANVDKCKAVAQIETDYKDKARIKILVPIQSEKVLQHIDRVPGVSVSAYADYAIKK